MSRKFEVGDRVRVKCPQSRHHGKVCTVTSELMRCRVKRGDKIELLYVHDVDLPPISASVLYVSFPPSELVPVYDGDEPATWDECVWKPREVTA